MIFMGTHILSGFGIAVVVAIGSATEIGKLQKAVEQVSLKMPLKKDLDFLSFLFLITSLFVAGALLILGALRDQVVSLCFLAFWIFDELFLGRQRKAQQMAWALSFFTKLHGTRG